jgi:hypothetical protein
LVSYIYLWYKTKQRFRAEEFQIPPHRQALSLYVTIAENFCYFNLNKYRLKILSLLFCLLIVLNSFGQKDFNKYDSIIFKSLKRNIGHPYPDNDAKIGANFLKFTKIDSTINIESLFKTDTAFEITSFKSFRRNINKELNDKIKPPFILVVPIYYFYDKETSFSKKTLRKIKKARRKIMKQGLHFSKQPFICIQEIIMMIR